MLVDSVELGFRSPVDSDEAKCEHKCPTEYKTTANEE